MIKERKNRTARDISVSQAQFGRSHPLVSSNADARLYGAFHDRRYYSHQEIEPVRLTSAEEQSLFLSLQDSPEDAKIVERIVRSYLFFALRQARKDMGHRTVEARMKCGLAEDDAISAANLGLMRAIRKFDPKNGARFTTYAGWWIKKALSEARYEVHAIKVPSSDRKKYSQFAKMIREGMRAEEISEILSVNLSEVVRILSLPGGRQDSFDAFQERVEAREVSRSMDNPTGEDQTPITCVSNPLQQVAEIAAEEDAERGEQEELLQKLEAAKMKLGTEELGLLHDRFSRSLSFAEIGKSRGLSAFLVKERIQTILHVLKITLSN